MSTPKMSTVKVHVQNCRQIIARISDINDLELAAVNDFTSLADE